MNLETTSSSISLSPKPQTLNTMPTLDNGRAQVCFVPDAIRHGPGTLQGFGFRVEGSGLGFLGFGVTFGVFFGGLGGGGGGGGAGFRFRVGGLHS